MKDKGLLKILGVAIPVLIAAFSEFADIKEKERQEERIQELETRLQDLESK